MNLNIYLEDELNEALIQLAKSVGKSRNAMIRYAIKLLLEKNKNAKWPASIMKFKGDKTLPAFESYRNH